MDFLNSFSPSRPIFNPKSSAIYTTSLDSRRDDFVNEMLPLGFADAGILFVAFPKVQKEAETHKVHLVNRQVEVG
jgi:hypothetical protein